MTKTCCSVNSYHNMMLKKLSFHKFPKDENRCAFTDNVIIFCQSEKKKTFFTFFISLENPLNIIIPCKKLYMR